MPILPPPTQTGHGPTVVLAVVVAVVGWRLLRAHRARRLRRDARQITILAPPQVEPSSAEALWTNLHALIRPAWRRALGDQPHLVFQYAWTCDGLTISLWVPNRVPPGLVERAVEAAWPGARATTGPASDPLPRQASAEGGQLRLAAGEHFPLRTDHPVDPLRPLLCAGAGLGEREVACVQILVRPVGQRRLARSYAAARMLRTDRPTGLATRLCNLPAQIVDEVLDLLIPGPPASARVSRPSDDPTRTADIRAILGKAAHPGWDVVVRYGVATSERGAGQRLRGHAHELASAFALYTGRNRFARHRLHRPAHAFAARRLGRGDLLSVPELAALAHLPTDVAVPGLARAGAKTIAPPPRVLAVGKVLGDAETGVRRPVALDPTDAVYHVHLLGATGSGKSTLLTNLVVQDVVAGRGAVVIDPKGDLIVDLLDRLPAAAAGRVVLIDPDEKTAPPSLNMLEGDDPDLVVDHLVGVFRRIFERSWGPRTDDVLRAACLTLLAQPGATLTDVPRLLSDPIWRRPRVEQLTDRILKGFWGWYEQLSQAEQAHVTGPVMNKLRAFLLRRFARDLVGSATSSFRMSDVLDGGLCLVRVPKGILGEETARLLGSLVVAKVWQAATARARTGQSARIDAALYVDECHNFLNLPHSFDDMLAEARGYRLSLVLAHQHLGQLGRELGQAVSANARNKLFFTISPEDAGKLERHVFPELSAHDLAHLGGYQAAARLVVAGVEQPAFTLRTRPAPPPIPGRAEAIRAVARRRYGRTVAQRRQEAVGRHTHPGAPSTGDGSAYGSAYGSGYESGYGPTPVDPGNGKHTGQARGRGYGRDPGL